MEKYKERTSAYQGELNFNDFKAGIQDGHIAQLDYLSRQILMAKRFTSEIYKQITDFQILKNWSIRRRSYVYDTIFFFSFHDEQYKIGELYLIPKEQS